MVKPFNKDDLQELVGLASEALGEEDRYLSKCAEQRPATFGDRRPPGIFRVFNERYYQCLILRRLLWSYRYAPDMEIDRFDLVLYDPAQQISKYAVVGEIKLWKTAQGRVELPSFRSDFAKIGRSGLTGFELIIDFHPTDPPGVANDNQAFLADILPVPLEYFTPPVSFDTKIPPWCMGEASPPPWRMGEVTIYGIFLPPEVSRGFAIATPATSQAPAQADIDG